MKKSILLSKIAVLVFLLPFGIQPNAHATDPAPPQVEQSDQKVQKRIQPKKIPLPGQTSQPGEAVTGIPDDPAEPGIGKDAIVKRFLEWYDAIHLAMLMLLGWVSKAVFKKSLTEERKEKIGKWAALIIFVPVFLVVVVYQTITGGMDVLTAIAVAGGIITTLGIHTFFINPIEDLFKKRDSNLKVEV